ncbi:MAG TPA: roadblock/LC7 domain-containing protein [Thermoanaerobaculia bacterium]
MVFQKILREMLQSTPGAIGAVFLDREGEAVDLFAEDVFEIGDDGLRTLGAYAGIFLSKVRRACETADAGEPLMLTLDFAKVKVFSCSLKDGYYLVLIVANTASEGVTVQRLIRCRNQLIAEI